MDCLISVIIPVYKIENYIGHCVESVLAQTYQNLEVILVDDGSPDSCGIICDSYKEKDGRVVVIHKENGGLADARNAAIDIAKGEYLTCIDGDDYVEPDYIEYLYRLLEDADADISCCGHMKVDEDGNATPSRRKKHLGTLTFTREEALAEMLCDHTLSNSAWAKLYKASLFSKVRYPKGKLFEDMFTTYKLIAGSHRVVYGEERKYDYLIRKTGLLTTAKAHKRMDVIEAEEEILTFARNNYPGLVRAARNRMFESAIVGLTFFDLKTKDDTLKADIGVLWKIIKKNRFGALTDGRIDIKYRLMSLVSLLGKRVCRSCFLACTK